MNYLLWLWRNSNGVRLNMFFRILAGFGQVAFGLWMVWLSRRFIDVTIRTGSQNDIIWACIELVLCLLCAVALRQTAAYHTVSAQIKLSNKLRQKYFNLLLRRRLYQDKWHSGDFTARLERDLTVVCELLVRMIPQSVVTAAQLLGAFLLMWSMESLLAWGLLLFTPIVVGCGKLFARNLRRMTLDIREYDTRIQMLVQEGMEHNAVLRSIDTQGTFGHRLGDLQEHLRKKVSRRAQFSLVSQTLLSITFGLGYLAAFVWGGLQLRSGVITFGIMTSFLQLVSQIQHPVVNLMGLFTGAIHASASIDRLNELDCLEVEVYSSLSDKLSHSSLYGVECRKISFRYKQEEHAVLHNFSHSFKPGSKTAIIGRTGTGKTTLFRLLLSLIEPQEGGLFLYNEEVRIPISTATRTHFVFVPQGNTLLSGTIRENLLLANPQASDEELSRVLHIAMADFVFSLPEGLDTRCGERGGGLSEGQAQRIAIARGLLRPGSILLLDEISSSLDEETEAQLLHRLSEACPNKTILFITHRPAVAMLCDESLSIC